MKSVLQYWHLFLFIIAGWVNRHQQDVVEYLRTENQVVPTKKSVLTEVIALAASRCHPRNSCVPS